MVRPAIRQLSELKFPWQYPTRSQSAMSFEMRLANSWTIRRMRLCNGALGSSTSAYSRISAWRTMSSRCSSCSCPPFLARRPCSSMWPTRVKDGATRQVMAHISVCILSGFRNWDLSCANAICLTSGGAIASGGATWSSSCSSTLGRGLSFAYQGLSVVSFVETTSDSARVVSTPMACIASDARNSRTLERSTARPSAPLQKGVWPPPLSCISQR
mmetsp:Transcript_45696/g.130434  ORF Transcript_45696/g.130434 Transcript_45696/m.130434 type:complete len:215 (-) Transcript_45696:48-692(-)